MPMRCEFPWHGMDDHTPCALWPGPDSKVARVTETKASRGPAEVRAHFRKCSGSLKTMGVHIYTYIYIYIYIYIHTHMYYLYGILTVRCWLNFL